MTINYLVVYEPSALTNDLHQYNTQNHIFENLWVQFHCQKIAVKIHN